MNICIALCFLLSLPFLAECRRARIQREMKGFRCRSMFTLFLRMLEETGILAGVDGSEDDFSEKLSEAFPFVTKQEAERMQNIVFRAAYSNKMPTQEEDEFVKRLYFQSARQICGNMAWHRKLWFCYIKAFI